MFCPSILFFTFLLLNKNNQTPVPKMKYNNVMAAIPTGRSYKATDSKATTINYISDTKIGYY